MFGLFFLLGVAFAAEPEPQFTKLKKGEVAPWNGRLFNDAAVAKFIVEDKYKIEQCNIITSYELNKQAANLNLAHQKITIDNQTQIKNLQEKVKLRDDRIKELEKIKKPPNAFLWTAAGFLVGAGTTVGITYAVNQ